MFKASVRNVGDANSIAGLGRNERLSRKNAADKLQPEYDKLSKQLKKGDIVEIDLKKVKED